MFKVKSKDINLSVASVNFEHVIADWRFMIIDIWINFNIGKVTCFGPVILGRIKIYTF